VAVITAGLAAAVAAPQAVAAPAQPGTQTPAETPAPEPAPVTQAPQQVDYTPTPQTAPVPEPVSQAVPGVSQAAQPLQPAEPQVVYVQGEPIVIHQTDYVDVEHPVGDGLYLGTEAGRRHITPDNVVRWVGQNYQDRDQATKDQLNLTAAAGTAGAVGGGLIGAGLGVIGGAAGGAAAGFAAGAIPVAITGATPIGPITATGQMAAAIAGGVAGAGAGAVVGTGVGAAAGGAAGVAAVPGGTEAAQDLAADTVFTGENEAREAEGYRGLVGDRPSGLPGYNAVDENANLDGSILDGASQQAPVADQQPAGDTVTAPAAEQAPETPVAPEVPEMPQPLQAVSDAVDASQDFSAGVIDNAQAQVAAAVTGQSDVPTFPVLPPLPA
jgi:hypothetical protein